MALHFRKITQKIVKILLWLVGGIIVLLIVVIILIQVPAVQNFAKQKIVSYLQAKLKTRVQIGKLRIIFPKQILLEDIYFGDQRQDTLLAGSRIQVDISMFRLLHKEISVSYIELDGIRAHIYRLGKDTSFNYAYLLKAFAGAPDTARTTDTSGGFSFNIGKVRLHDIVATYKDDATGNDVYLNLGDFNTHIRTFDPTHSLFSIPDIDLSHVVARIRQYKPLNILPGSPAAAGPVPKSTIGAGPTPGGPQQASARDTSAAGPAISLELGTVTLGHIAVDYGNDISRMRSSIRLGSFKVITDSIDLRRMVVALKNIRIDSTDLSYDQDAQKRLAKGLDYHHLKVAGLVFQADHIGVSPTTYQGNITRISFLEQSGLLIKKFTGAFTYNNHEAHIKGLDIQTGNSEIKNETDASYPSVDSIAKHPGSLYVDTRFDRSVISASDIFLFQPALEKQFRASGVTGTAPFRLNGQIRGYVSNLTIPGLQVSGLSRTSLSIKGTIKGLPDAQKAFYDLTILHLATGRADVNALIPAGTLPSNIHVPESLAASGVFRGTVKAFQTRLNTQTSNGNAQVQGHMDLVHQAYDATATLDELDLGYILGQSNHLGKISLNLTAKGEGFAYPALNTDIQAHLSDGMINGYDFKDLVLNGSFQHGHGILHSSLKDTEVAYQLDGEANVQAGSKFPSLNLTLQIDTLDLHALHLVSDTLQVKGLVKAHFSSTNPDSLQGALDLLHWTVNENNRILRADSIALVALHPADSQYIHLYSDMAVLDWKGKYALSQVPEALERTINHFYNIPGYKDSAFSDQSWVMDALIKPSPLLLSFVPALKGTDTLGLHATFNSAQNDLKQVARASIGTFPLNQAAVYGNLSDNHLFTTALLKDDKAKDWYRVAAQLSKDGTAAESTGTIHAAAAAGPTHAAPAAGWKIVLHPDSLLLNHTAWTVSPGNFIHYDSSGVVAHDLRISHQGQSMEINSVSQDPASPIDITFNGFHLGTLTSAAGQDSLLVDGVLNGKVSVEHVTTNPTFTSDLVIKDLSYKADTLGDLNLKVNNEEANTFAADLSLEGHQSDLKVTGKYYTGDSKMDMNLHLGALNLAAVKPFAAGQLDDISGILKGDMHITGTASRPVPNGDLHFENAIITPNITGEPLHLSNDNIEFDNTGFNFSEFLLQDSAGNKATVDGNVYTTDFRNYKFDMTFNASNFRLVNAPQATNRLFYGKLNMDAAVNLEGTMDLPKVDGDLHINKQTDFTFVLPENDPEVISRKGVVRFVDKDHPGDTLMTALQLDSLSATAPMKGMNISANISTDSSANFTMIIDQRNGDALKVRGRSNLNFGMDESGKTSLTGNYEIEAGSYNLTLEILKRTFNIQRGSTITWTGDPTSARLDLTATYLANTAPIDLVQDEISGRSETDINKFKQKLPFTISLKMEGELLKPIITFDISLPSNLLLQWPDVDTKLQQVRSEPSELNKQVFAVLLLGHFVGDNPLVSAGGSTSAGQMAFSSSRASSINWPPV